MPVESVTYISDLNASNPVGGTDLVSTLDDHIRNLKTGIKNTFPSVSGAVSATHTELSYVHNVTSAIQTQLDAKAPSASPTFTGTPTAPTPATTDNSTTIPTTAMVQAAITAAALSATLPGQLGNAGKLINTDGTTASWSNLLNAGVLRWKDGTDATKLLALSLSGITTGTTRTITVPDKSGTLSFTSDGFTSAEQTITLGGSLTIAHGLGVIPRFILGYFKCVTAELGYSIGDVVAVSLGATGANLGFAVIPDATNLNVRYGSGTPIIINKTTGATGTITPANWTFSLRAYV
jgi:hypothetical protein